MCVGRDVAEVSDGRRVVSSPAAAEGLQVAGEFGERDQVLVFPGNARSALTAGLLNHARGASCMLLLFSFVFVTPP